MSNQDTWPELGEFLVCTIGSVKQNGVYVDLDGYPGREGFIFIGEVASGWVKNIRSIVREGQRVVAKVINCLLYTSPSPRDKRQSRMPSSA